MSIAIDRAKSALFDIDQYTEVFYLPDLDRFVYVPSEGDDIDLDEYDGEVIPLPNHYDINNYRMMQDFMEEETTGDIHDWLKNALIGKGAFRRFRATCDRFGITNDWYRYQEKCYEDIAIYWCEQNGLAYYFEEPAKPEEEEEPLPVINSKAKVVSINEKNAYAIYYMNIEFRKELAALRNGVSDADLESAEAEIGFYLSRRYPIFAASINGNFIGYAVCRVDDEVVWLESVYVKKEYRNQGNATMLLKKCEEVAKEYGNETLYVYINPNNEQVIGLLNKNGYDVLNLIEVRKKYSGEKLEGEYRIGDHTYKY